MGFFLILKSWLYLPKEKKNGQKNTQFTGEIYLVDKHMLKCLVLLVIREMKSKTMPIKF